METDRLLKWIVIAKDTMEYENFQFVEDFKWC